MTPSCTHTNKIERASACSANGLYASPPSRSVQTTALSRQSCQMPSMTAFLCSSTILPSGVGILGCHVSRLASFLAIAKHSVLNTLAEIVSRAQADTIAAREACSA